MSRSEWPMEKHSEKSIDLAQEMCITVSRPGTNWQKVLSPLDFDPDSSEVHRFSFARNSSAINGKILTYYRNLSY